jgi:hypothetical protein
VIEAMKRWRDALNQALEWDGYDSEGVPSVWHDVANKAIAEMDAAIKAAGKPFGYLCEWRSIMAAARWLP